MLITFKVTQNEWLKICNFPISKRRKQCPLPPPPIANDIIVIVDHGDWSAPFPVLLQCYYFTRTWLRYVRVFAVANPSVVCLSVCLSVTLVHPAQGVEPFGKISSALCTLAILWPPCKILRRLSQLNSSIGGAKRNRGSKVERRWIYWRMCHTYSMSRLGLSSCDWVSCQVCAVFICH